MPTIDSATFRANLDLAALRPPAGVAYWTTPTAPDTGTGTESDPTSLRSILAKQDVGTVYLAPGEYSREASGGLLPTRSINWLPTGPGVQLTGWNRVGATRWTAVTGHVYSTTRSGTGGIVDVATRTAWGDHTTYLRRGNLASIDGPGQWALDGATVYVWPIGDTDLTVDANREQIRLQVASMSGVVADNTVQYVEGIEFLGCSVGAGYQFNGGLLGRNNGLIIAKDCAVKYNVNDNGPQTKGGFAIFVNVEASSNMMDGFNHHDTQYVGGEFIELGCRAHHNGIPAVGGAPNVNNGTSAHEAVAGVRVGGRYEHSAGPVVADVNSAHTWNVDCYAGGQAPGAGVAASQDQSWRVDAAGYEEAPAQMWLDHCTSDSATYAYRVSGPGAIHVHAPVTANTNLLYPGTTVQEYAR